MLHLQPGVHLEKVEIPLGVHDQFHRSGGAVVHRPGKRPCLGAHGVPGLRIDEGRRRLLHHLLVAALDRAFTLIQCNHVAVGVSDDLDLDVPGLFDEFLNENPAVPEARHGLAGRALESVAASGLVEGDPHALAAAPGAGLDHHGIADAPGNGNGLVGILHHIGVTGYHIDPGLLGDVLGGDLVPHGLDGAHAGTDERDALGFEAGGKCRVFGEKAVAWMHGLRTGVVTGLNNPFRDQVALRCGGGADVDSLVGLVHVARIAVGIGVHRHRGDAHAPGGPDHPAGDFATIGDQDLLEHGRALIKVEYCRASSMDC